MLSEGLGWILNVGAWREVLAGFTAKQIIVLLFGALMFGGLITVAVLGGLFVL